MPLLGYEFPYLMLPRTFRNRGTIVSHSLLIAPHSLLVVVRFILSASSRSWAAGCCMLFGAARDMPMQKKTTTPEQERRCSRWAKCWRIHTEPEHISIHKNKRDNGTPFNHDSELTNRNHENSFREHWSKGSKPGKTDTPTTPMMKSMMSC